MSGTVSADASASSMNIVLVAPLVPQNTGSIARLTAATNCLLHLIEPLGFKLEDRYLKRAGLDYWPEVRMLVHSNWDKFLAATQAAAEKIWLFSSHATTNYWDVKYSSGDYLVFGNEGSGLPQHLHELYANHRCLIPMDNPKVRSLNLANAASIVLYEARRQLSLDH